MTDKILNGLMDVFKDADNQLLTLKEITHRMKDRGYYQNVELAEARQNLYVYYLKPPYFHEKKNYRNTNWGRKWNVAHWLPSKENAQLATTQRKKRLVRYHPKKTPSWLRLKENIQSRRAKTHMHQAKKRIKHQPIVIISPLQIGQEILRTISPKGIEIENGTIPLRGQESDSFFTSMDEEQRNRSNIDIYYYANDNTICNIARDDHNNWHIKSAWLQDWYKENSIEPGDKIWLIVKNVAPLQLNIYTEWERNPDTYRRYRQLQESKPLFSVDSSIQDIIWDFFEQTQKIAHRLHIAKAVLEKRPEASEQSVYGCLSANPYLFVRVGEGNWGLKEWGLEDVTMAAHPAGRTFEENLSQNMPTTTVPLDYILATIASENMVDNILRNSKKPLTVDEITERISKTLYVDKKILARATFFDPSDARLIRLYDGTFTLRENLEKNNDQTVTSEQQLLQSLESTNEENISTKNEIQATTTQHEPPIKQLENERDNPQSLDQGWFENNEKAASTPTEHTQVLPKFLGKTLPYVGMAVIKWFSNAYTTIQNCLSRRKNK